MGHDLHAKRVASLAGATLGVVTSASLAVAMVGQALAQARGLATKHTIKQVDRLDWADFDRDGQSTLALALVTGHGRATPLVNRPGFVGGSNF